MTTLELWKPKPAINLFMAAKKRRDCSDVIERKATRAPYFKGIFETVDEDNDGAVFEAINVQKKF